MTDITAFGYAVPFVVVLASMALVAVIGLAVAFYLTIGWSVYRAVKDTRRDRVRDDLRSQLLDRLFEDDPEWDEWVAGLSGIEREVTESLLDDHLRKLDGHNSEKLRALGDALGIPARAGQALTDGDEFERLHALTWLTLLERPVPYRAADFEPQTARERAATAYLCLETGGDPGAVVSLLLSDVDDELTVFGQDSLYRAARSDPDALFETAAENYQSWPDSLLVQVLSVAQHLDTTVGSQNLSWLTSALEHGDPDVRAAAARALGTFGWRRSLRDQVFLERAVDDPSPAVRGAVYEMLGAWGDDAALSILMYGLIAEEDQRALLTGTNALVKHRDRVGSEVTVFGDAWAWSSEHADFDRIVNGNGEEVEV